MKVKPRSIYAEYQILLKYFGFEAMKIWYENFDMYKNSREKWTYQQIFDLLKN